MCILDGRGDAGLTVPGGRYRAVRFVIAARRHGEWCRGDMDENEARDDGARPRLASRGITDLLGEQCSVVVLGEE